MFFLFFVGLIVPQFHNADIKNTLHSALTASNKESLKNYNSHYEKLKACFSNSDYCHDIRYISYTEIYNLINSSRKDYCIFLENDCYLYDLYDAKIVLLRPEFAAACLYRVPVLNVSYEDGDFYVRCDGRKSWKKTSRFSYGMMTIKHHSENLTSENMIDYAKKIGKKHIIVLSGDTYSVVDVYNTK